MKRRSGITKGCGTQSCVTVMSYNIVMSFFPKKKEGMASSLCFMKMEEAAGVAVSQFRYQAHPVLGCPEITAAIVVSAHALHPLF